LIKRIFGQAEKTENEHCFLTAFAVLAAVFLIAMMIGNSLGAVITASAAEGGNEKKSAKNAGGIETETVTATETRTISLHEIITYDIWKHINGVWQFGKSPGSNVSGAFTAAIDSKLPQGANVTGVYGAYDSGYAGVYSVNAVSSASVNIKSFTDKNFTYSFAAKLDGNPADIKKSTQAEEVEGYRYYIPVVFEITYTVTVSKEVPKQEPGSTDDDDKTPIDQNAEITGEARLVLPERSYEGHSVTANDRSIFTVNKKTYGAARMYDEKLALNSFRTSGAGSSAKRSGDTSAEVSFAQPGRAEVLLAVTIKGGLKLTDKKYIDVLRTPSISSVLGGTQKQNRKQIIIAEIAVNPQHPLKELWIEIEKKGGAERVHLNYDTYGGKNSFKNSAFIKTRAIINDGSNNLFTRVRLEFLTKNNEETEMTYRIYARDDRGYTDTVEKAFKVFPDQAPQVIIDAEKEQLRDEQSSIAYIYAEDATIYDGDDAERVWYVRERGETKWHKAGNGKDSAAGNINSAGNPVITDDCNIRDASFGTWKAVVYEKTGVGKLDIRLEVTEKWIEDTLPEYISEKDILSGSAETQVNVINIAPIVSLNSMRMKTANLLFLTSLGTEKPAQNQDSKEEIKNENNELTKLQTKTSAIRNTLFERGINAKIDIKTIKSASELNKSDTADSIFTLTRGYGYGAGDTFLEKNWYVCGKNTLYTVDGEWTRDTGMSKIYNYKQGAPYTINAYDLCGKDNKQNLKWTVTVTKEQLGHNNISKIKGMALDDKSQYLFFRSDEKTLIYDGKTGAYTAAVPLAFGDDNYAENGRIYTVRADGVYYVDLKTGNVKKLYSGDICMKSSYCDDAGNTRRINNEVHFFAGKGMKLAHGIFNLTNENLRFEEIYPSQAKYNSTYNVVGIGVDERVCIGQDGKSIAYVFDCNGRETACISGWKTGNGHDIIPVYKDNGTFDYIIVMYNTDIRTGSSKNGYKKDYGIYMDVYSADMQANGTGGALDSTYGSMGSGGKSASYSYVRKVSDSAPPGSGSDAAKAMYAVQIGNEVIVNNGDWATSISDGSLLSNYYYTSFSQIVFDIKSGTAQRYVNGLTKYGELGIGGPVCEYGKVTDDYIVSAYSRDNAGIEYGAEGNEQSLKVARLPKTTDSELSVYINKFAPKKFTADLDIAAVILCDSAADAFNDRPVENITQIDDEQLKNSLYEQSENSLSVSDNILMIMNTETETSFAAETISAAGGNGKCIKVSAGGSGTADDVFEKGKTVTAKKKYKLLPDTEYYYELEYAGDAALPLEIQLEKKTQIPQNAKLTGDTYTVIAVQNEDFNAVETLNQYFSGWEKGRVHEGKYYGAEMVFADDIGGKNKAVTNTSELTFEIEKGETAILQFDYILAGEQNSPDEVYINVNGERWYRNIHISNDSGTYTHPYILPEGRNTVSFGAKFYGTRPGDVYAAIDNLKVIYLEKGESAERRNKNGSNSEDTNTAGNTVSTVNIDRNQFRRISGRIRTPQKIVSYAGQPMKYIKQQIGNPAQTFIENIKAQNRNDLKITVPEGMKAVHTAVTLKSLPADKYPVQWNFDGKKYSVNYKTTLNLHALQVPREFRVNTDKSEGTISISPGNLYKRSAGYGEIEMILAEDIHTPVSEGKYFAVPTNSGDDAETESGILYIQNETFDGYVTISISGTGMWRIKDFRLYRIENGRRIYEDNGNFETANGEWQITGGSAAEETFDGEQSFGNAVQSLVYKKGEMIKYNAVYYDYEADPSKAQYWRYTHTPANDGMHPQTGQTLSSPIEQFYIDGKYTVEHWQEDSTGNIEYDKQSNIAEMTFYIESGAGAPWITNIETVPEKVNAGQAAVLEIGVDDMEKDVLYLKTELYFKNKVIYTYQRANITANKNGKYPNTLTDKIALAEAGEYKAVCTVRDGSGTGIREYTFKAGLSDGIKGRAEHFPAWENARIEYNKNNLSSPRAANVFWAAEAFKLTAEAYGRPSRVTAMIKEYPEQKVKLVPQSISEGVVNKEKKIYEASLFDSSVSADLAKKCADSPGGICTLSFIFTAEYPDGHSLTDTVTVIIDDNGGGLRIHRVF